MNQLIATFGAPADSPHSGAKLWRRVPAAQIAPFLDGFFVHPLNHDFQGDSIAEFLLALPSDEEVLAHWTVALLTTGEGGPVDFSPLPNLEILAKKRKVEHRPATRSLLVSGSKARVGSRRDVIYGLSLAAAKSVRDQAAGEANRPTEDDYRQRMPAPLLLIYLIRGYDTAGAEWRPGSVLPALGLHFPGVSQPDEQRRLVRYRLNRIAQEELLGSDRNDDQPDEDPDD